MFNVFPGIGDIGWVYAKMGDLVEAGVPIEYRILDMNPRRSSDFVDLLPGVKNLGYGPPVPNFEGGVNPSRVPDPLPSWFDLSMADPGSEYTALVNRFLEQGMRLEYVWPTQKTHYHYKLNTAPYEKQAAEVVADLSRPVIGYYCSSYAHRPGFGFWQAHQWLEFLKGVAVLFPAATFLALGAAYDDKTAKVHELCRYAGLSCASAVGQTHIGATIEVIRRLDYFFAFPSGLGILADVVDTPCTMWYWRGVNDAFINTYADPVNVANLRHVNRLYEPVDAALAAFQEGAYLWL